MLSLLGASIDLPSGPNEGLLPPFALGRRKGGEMALEDRADPPYSITLNENSGQISTGSFDAGFIASANSGGILS